MDKTDLAARMKDYEFRETERKFLPMLPIYARIDGRNFSAFTKGMRRPYDERMHDAMVETTKYLVDHTHAKIGYTQSDEISLVWYAPDYKSESFFGGKVHKITSVIAAMATVAFNHAIWNSDDAEFRKFINRMPHFDARVFSLPSEVEAANTVLWRCIDCFKNSVSMVAHHHFSHKSLHGQNQAQMQERLFQEKGINFGQDMPDWFKNGTFVRRTTTERSLTEEELARIPECHRPLPGTLFTRNKVEPISMPIFSKVANRVGVIFYNEEPETESEQQDRIAWEAEGIAEARASIAAGQLVTWEQVDAWINSLGTDNELPIPKPLN